MTGTATRSRWLPIHAVLVFSFLYLPIVVLIVYSFNGAGVGGFPPRDLTLRWYRLLFGDQSIWDAVLNFALEAGFFVLLSLAPGIPAALEIHRAEFSRKTLLPR